VSGRGHFERLERTYLSSPTNAYYRPSIEVGEGRARIAIEARPDLYHAAGAVHGSHYFKLLDDSAFFAVNSVVEDVFVLTVTFTVNLLRPVSEGPMVGEGKLVHRTRTLFWGESVLYDGQGRAIGRGQGTFVRSKIPLDERIGYA